MASNGSGEIRCDCSMAELWPHRVSACGLRRAARTLETASQQAEEMAVEALRGLDSAAVQASQQLEVMSSAMAQQVREQANAVLYLRPSWNTSYASAMGVMRTASHSLPADVKTLRMTTDHEIPRWLPTLPRGVTSSVSAVPPGEWCHLDHVSLTDLSSLASIHDSKLILYIHGGGFCMCNTATHRGFLYRLVKVTGAIVFAVEYRRPPEHPYPAPVDDCVQAYTHLLEHIEPSRVYFAGDSAGACLAVSAILSADEMGLPRPAGAVLLSPWVDLGDTSSDSWMRNASYDFVRPDLANYCAELYKGKASWEEVSPSLFSEEALARLPPLLIEYGECEVFFDQISIFAGKCSSVGVKVDLNVREGNVSHHRFKYSLFLQQIWRTDFPYFHSQD